MAVENRFPDTDEAFEQDIRRSIILAKYIVYWGQPQIRQSFGFDDGRVEVYFFPAKGNGKVSRLATIGCSGAVRESITRYELFCALPADLGEASFEDTARFMIDLEDRFRTAEFKPRVGTVVDALRFKPSSWKMTAALLDEPTGEPEELSVSHVAHQHVNLYWIVPVHGDEAQLIRSRGLEEFDRRQSRAELSLLDVRRPSVCDPEGS